MDTRQRPTNNAMEVWIHVKQEVQITQEFEMYKITSNESTQGEYIH
jgi:hypothetical protein